MRLALSLLFLFSTALAFAQPAPEAPWFTPVQGFVPPAPGEHPRLFFRKTDVPALRERAKTPEGQAMIARLKLLLGGGEAMPTAYSDASDYSKASTVPLPVGAYGLWHAMGFGMLYQLTGEQKYADLGRQCVEKTFAGVRDPDSRYAWLNPGGFLRQGPVLSAVAMAYDLCYDGWDAAFRKSVAEQLITYKQYTRRDGGGTVTLERLAMSPNLKPTSNHWGLQVGGAGLVVLALKGDPGVDDALMTTYLEGVERNAVAALRRGWGDGGYFYEHPGPGWIGASWTFLPFLQAERVANGKDWLTPRRNASWLTMKFAAQILPTVKEGPMYPNPAPGGGYGTEYLVQNGGHHAGYFSEGFGAVRPEQAPALLWVYNHFVRPSEATRYPKQVQPGEQSYDAFHPLRAVLAFVNWPLGMQEQNPAEIIPKVTCDTYYGHYLFRNRWQDENDIEVGALFGGRAGDGVRRVMVWGLGQRMTFGKLAPSVVDGQPGRARVDRFTPAEDGSGIVAGGGTCIAVDYSKASGADAVIAMVGPGAAPGKSAGHAKAYSVLLGDTPVELLVLSMDQQPEPVVEGDRIVLGGQTITYDGKALKLGVMAGAPKLRQ